MITPSQARLKEKEQFLEEYDRSRSRSAKRKITTPLQARLKEKEQFLEDYDYDRSRSRSAKRKIKKVTRQSETKKKMVQQNQLLDKLEYLHVNGDILPVTKNKIPRHHLNSATESSRNGIIIYTFLQSWSQV